MKLSKLEYTTQQRDPQTKIYVLTGSLHGTHEGYALQEDIRGAVSSGVRKIVLDMAGVERIDSSGVGILVASMWSVSQGGAGLILAALPPRVEKVLGIALLLDRIGHAASVDEALEQLDAMNLPPSDSAPR